MRGCALLIAAQMLVSCTTAGAPAARSLDAREKSRVGTIEGAEIARLYHDGSLLEALRGLRPQYLTPRGGRGEVAVYVDHIRVLGGVSDLATIRTGTVAEVRFLTPTEATIRFGTGHMAGAIVVELRKRSGTRW